MALTLFCNLLGKKPATFSLYCVTVTLLGPPRTERGFSVDGSSKFFSIHNGSGSCSLPWILLTMLQILRAGPNFMSMYFIIIFTSKRSKALPSIS